MKAIIERLFGLKIYRNSFPKRTDVFHDLKNDFQFPSGGTIVDVGANEGQNIPSYLRLRAAKILAIEPQRDLAERLRLQGRPNVVVDCCALSNETAESVDFSIPASRNSMGTLDHAHLANLTTDTIKVPVTTLDNLILKHGIEYIDFLKIDTEGHDLRVLKGALSLFGRQRISTALVETCLGNRTTFHVPICEFNEFFYGQGFELYGVYDQSDSYTDKELWYINALYFHKSLRNRN